MPGHADVAGSQLCAYLAAGDRDAPHHHHWIDMYIKAKFTAKLFQARGCALCLVAEMKIIPFMHFLRMQYAGKNVARKVLGCGHGEVAREGNFQQGVNTSFCQQRFFFHQRGNQARRNIWPKNAEWVRLKCNGHGLTVALARALNNFLQYALMATVNTIKVSNADNSGSKLRYFFQRAEYPHAMSNSSFNPSCASRTFSGRFLLVSSCGRSWEMWVKKA